jgi:hypothetical protein
MRIRVEPRDVFGEGRDRQPDGQVQRCGLACAIWTHRSDDSDASKNPGRGACPHIPELPLGIRFRTELRSENLCLDFKRLRCVLLVL